MSAADLTPAAYKRTLAAADRIAAPRGPPSRRTRRAGVSIPAHARDALRRLCRYVLRPPVARDRLERRDDGRVVLRLKRPQVNGTTEILFTPRERPSPRS